MDTRDLSVRILVVNDSEQFRRLVSVILAMRQNLQVVGEASDGSEAVHKAAELKPDLIILDIDLPNVNGIEAARQIRRCAPQSKIILLSPGVSAVFVPEALSLGAAGYLLKLNVGTELLVAVEAVLLGRQFVSKEFSADEYASLEHVTPFVFSS
jgi:DNA-binding NarL/FixJ family response regulator